MGLVLYCLRLEWALISLLGLRLWYSALWYKARSFFKKKIIYLLCIQYSVCMYACRPEESTRSHYRWLWATMWLLGIELRTFGRAGNALNFWAISPAPKPDLCMSATSTGFSWCNDRNLSYLSFQTSHLDSVHPVYHREMHSTSTHTPTFIPLKYGI